MKTFLKSVIGIVTITAVAATAQAQGIAAGTRHGAGAGASAGYQVLGPVGGFVGGVVGGVTGGVLGGVEGVLGVPESQYRPHAVPAHARRYSYHRHQRSY